MRRERMSGFLLKRKSYPDGIISNGIERAKAIDRRDLLRPKIHSPDGGNIPFVFTNNCANPQVLNLVRGATHMLAPSSRMSQVMSGKKIVAARRQPPNLKTHLFRPRFETTPSGTKGSVVACKNVPNKKPTRGQPCRCCESINECAVFRFYGSNEDFEIRWHFTCDSMNLLYALTCSGCGKNYIGQTERSVRDRCGDYRRAVSNERFHTQGVHKHIAQCGNGSFTFTPFFKNKEF